MDNLFKSFMAEARELMEEIEKGLLKLEKDPENVESISAVFRSMHTLKGSSGMFGLQRVTSLTHNLENIFDSIRAGKIKLNKDILTLSFQTFDHLQKVFKDPEFTDQGLVSAHDQLENKIKKFVTNNSEESVENSEKEPDKVEEIFYIRFSPSAESLKKGSNPLYVVEDLLAMGEGIVIPSMINLPVIDELQEDKNYTTFEILLSTTQGREVVNDAFIFADEETIVVVEQIDIPGLKLDKTLQQKIFQEHDKYQVFGLEKLTALLPRPLRSETDKSNGSAGKTKNQKVVSSIRVDSDRIDELMNLISELVTTQAQLSTFSHSFESQQLSAIGENIEKITRRLRDNAFSMSLIPIESLIVRFQRLVRDLSSELNKEVSFITEGTDTEIDKSIVEKLTDPILHILRNSLDHGIEMPEERKKLGKNPQGKIHFKSYYSGANVVIEISDDGAGIPTEKIRKKAIEKGLIEESSHLDKQEILQLIFSPGFSTAEQVTGVSGRGVGMDVVRRNIHDLRGEIEVVSKEGDGTTFIINLPLTLSIIDGLLVNVGDTEYILPLQSVDKCYEINTSHFRTSHNDWVTLDGERTPYIFLREKFDVFNEDPEYSQVIKIMHKKKYVGLVVDKIIGEYQAVLKPLGDQYQGQDEFSGATILGDGSVALVMDPLRLINKMTENKLLSHYE